jgi:1,4-dihydroxy-6-naphthoate synthase
MSSAKHKVSIAHSPDPDDAFMFYALATGKVRSDIVTFEHVLGDIQTLNAEARQGRYEMTAISYHAYPYVSDLYILTSAGSSIGDGYGPIVVSKYGLKPSELKGKTIAVPGTLTTAYLALKLFEPDFKEKVVPFDQILETVESGEADAGVVIHEGQLVYSQTGLHNVLDLGVWWKQEHNLPLPLGANAILRSLPADVQQESRRCLSESIQYALDNRAEALAYALEFGRGLDTQLADKFVGMYVNEYTTEMRPPVIESAQKLLDMGYETGLIPKRVQVEYV